MMKKNLIQWTIAGTLRPQAAKAGLALALALSLALSVTSLPALAETVIKLAQPNRNDAFDNAAAAMAIVFKNNVEATTKHRIRVDIFPEGQMGKDDAVVKLVQQGTIQSAISSVSGVTPLYPLLAVLDLPFAYRSIINAYDVFDGPFGRRLATDIRSKTGLAVLGYGDPGGLFVITNSKRRIRRPEDMKGLRIRTMDLDTHHAMVHSLGATPVTIAWPELYNALGTGAVDGQMNPIPIIRFARFDEVQRYLTLTNHLFLPYIWVFNAKALDKLAPSDRMVVLDSARLGVIASRGLSRLIEASNRGLPPLTQHMEVDVLTPEERDAFRQVTQPAVRAAIKKRFGAVGVELLASFERAIREAQ